jgi:hypothetical protein
MPQQSLLDQMSSGAIFALNPSYQNPTVTRYNRLYTEIPNSYTALAPNVVQSHSPSNCLQFSSAHRPQSYMKPRIVKEVAEGSRNDVFTGPYLRSLINKYETNTATNKIYSGFGQTFEAQFM